MPQNKNVVLADTSYQRLLISIRREMTQGMVRAQKELEYQKLVTYWRIGQLVTRDFLKGKSRPQVGSRLYERLGEDLNLTARSLQDMVRVYREYPKQPKKENITFSHYTLLTRVENKRKRDALKRRIVREQLTFSELRQLIRDAIPRKKLVSVGKLPTERGLLYHYRTVTNSTEHTQELGIELDLGFENYMPCDQYSRGKILESVKTSQGYTKRQLKVQPPRNILYTYVAHIVRIVDADTLLVKVDCGFNLRTRQRLRLRGIDAPELKTQRGKEAKDYLQEMFKNISWVIIKTYNSDKYDRYLVDVFYQTGENNPHKVAKTGIFLNQQLLDVGYADIWRK